MLDWIVGGRKPKRAPEHRSAAPVQQGGLVAGTLVATTRGWVAAEQICVGDEVLTFDDGVQVVTGVTRRLHPMPGTGPAGLRPLLSVQAGMIGNRRAMLLPEGQPMMVESDLAESLLGDPFAALDSAELLGLPGVRKVLPEDSVVVATISFECDQMIFVEGNALALCPSHSVAAPETIEEAIWSGDKVRYPVLAHDDAEMIVAGMASGMGRASTYPTHLS